MKQSSTYTLLVSAIVLALSLPLSASAWYYDYYYVPTYYPVQYYYPEYAYYSYPTAYYQPTYYVPEYVSYPSYGYSGYSSYGYSTPSPSNWSYPTGDTDTFGYDICNWEGYGRGRCDSNPRQPVYDHWTGTWY